MSETQIASRNITIEGLKFRVPEPYSEGSVLKANEAAALNQTYAEGIRNNRAKHVKAAKDKAEAEGGNLDLSTIQAEIDAYAADYEFGTRRAGDGGAPGLPKDPIERQAHLMARELIRAHAKSKGVKVEADWVASKVPELLAKRPDIMEEANRRVAAQSAVSLEELELPEEEATEDETGEEAEAEADAEASPKRRQRK